MRPGTYLTSDSDSFSRQNGEDSNQQVDARSILYMSWCQRTTVVTIREMTNHSRCPVVGEIRKEGLPKSAAQSETCRSRVR